MITDSPSQARHGAFPVGPRASHVLPGGTSEEAAFQEVDGIQVMTVVNLPLSSPRGLVVICSPLFAEFQKNYRREILLARALASRGFASARFHYPGSGNSGGHPGEVGFATVTAAADQVARRVGSELGVEHVAFLGTRFGALVAAVGARGWEGAPLVLWEPVAEPQRHLDEIIRMAQLHGMTTTKVDVAAMRREMLKRLETEGVLDVLGYQIHRTFYETTAGRTLSGEMEYDGRNTLLVQVGGRQLRRRFATLAEEIRAAGHSVDTAIISHSEAWWATAGGDYFRAEDQQPLVKDLLATTTSWIISQAGWSGR